MFFLLAFRRGKPSFFLFSVNFLTTHMSTSSVIVSGLKSLICDNASDLNTKRVNSLRTIYHFIQAHNILISLMKMFFVNSQIAAMPSPKFYISTKIENKTKFYEYISKQFYFLPFLVEFDSPQSIPVSIGKMDVRVAVL